MAQEIQSRKWEKKNKEQTNNVAWVSSKCKKRSYVTLHSLCICRLTLAWISSEISTKLLGMLTHLDRSSLTAAGLIRCPVSTGNCTSASPVANWLLWVLSSNCWLVFPFYFRSLEISSLNPLSGFVPKQTKGLSVLWTTYIVSWKYGVFLTINPRTIFSACLCINQISGNIQLILENILWNNLTICE